MGCSRRHHRTLLWFPSTLAFGWYVTRIADYSMFYGSLAPASPPWSGSTSPRSASCIGAELNGASSGNGRPVFRLPAKSDPAFAVV
jgi:hypothetical protein